MHKAPLAFYEKAYPVRTLNYQEHHSGARTVYSKDPQKTGKERPLLFLPQPHEENP